MKPKYIQQLLDYENGKLDEVATIELFQELIDSGLAWELQGSYGSKAIELIRNGYCGHAKGEELANGDEQTYAMYGIDDGPAPYTGSDRRRPGSNKPRQTNPTMRDEVRMPQTKHVGAIWSQEAD